MHYVDEQLHAECFNQAEDFHANAVSKRNHIRCSLLITL